MRRTETRLALAAALLSLGCVGSTATTTPMPLALDAATENVSLRPHAAWMEEEGERLRVEDVAAIGVEKWQPVTHENLGFRSHAVWFRVTLVGQPAADAERVLQIGNAELASLELYLPDGKGGWALKRGGTDLPFGQRELPARFFGFTVRIPAAQEVTAYLRVFAGVAPTDVPLTLKTRRVFFARDAIRHDSSALFAGFALALALYNLLLFAALRDRSYLFYVLYLVSFGAMILTGTGAAFEHAWPNSPWFAGRAHLFFFGLGVSFATFFARSFLQTRERNPRMDWMLLGCAGYGAVIAGCALLGFPLAFSLGAPLALCWPALQIGSGIVSLRGGYRPAAFYLLAWTTYAASLLVNWVTVLGVLPAGALARDAFVFGAMIEAVLLALALAHRVRVMQQQLADQHEQIFHMQKLEAVGTLAGGIAHDFNNLLTSILGYAKELQRGALKPDEVQRGASVILRAAERASTLTRQLLGFARRGKAQVVPVDLHAVVREVVSLLRHSMDARIQVSEELSARQPYAMGDPVQLQQVILNLAVNARDAMPEGGQLRFCTEDSELDPADARRRGLPPGAYTVLSLVDTGGGIARENLPRLFEPFFTTKPPGQGTGMGLAMAYGIVSNHGGRIEVESRLGEGAHFRIFLPRSEHVPATAPAATKSIGHVLVVDMDRDSRAVAERILADSGYRVTVADGAEQAVEVFRARSDDFDLVLLDLDFPAASSGQLFERLREIDPEVRLVLATQSGTGPSRALPREGIAGVLRKPWAADELRRAVEQAM